MHFLKRFYLYQKERFPILFLALSFLPPVLSSAAVLSGRTLVLHIFVSLLLALMYLLHIRIADEKRDYSHDNLHHAKRPVQKKLISINDLTQIDRVIGVIFFCTLFFIGFVPLILGIVLWAYTYISEKEFFIGARLKRHFFYYNTLNLIQMLLLQVLIYSIFFQVFFDIKLLLLHFMFTGSGTVAFEFLRKLKLPGKDGTGKDTYSYHLGFEKAMLVFLMISFINVLLFFLLANAFLDTGLLLIISFTSAFFVLLSLSLSSFTKGKSVMGYVQLNYFLIYSLLNLLVYKYYV